RLRKEERDADAAAERENLRGDAAGGRTQELRRAVSPLYRACWLRARRCSDSGGDVEGRKGAVNEGEGSGKSESSVSVRATAFVTCVAAARECAVHEDHGHDPTWGRARGMGKTSRALAG